MQNLINRIGQFRTTARKVILTNWYGVESKMYQTSAQEIQDILQKRFETAKNIQVEDKSGGCGAMFEIYIESPEFKKLSIPKQHKVVYDTLKEQIKVIHGLRLVTKAI